MAASTPAIACCKGCVASCSAHSDWQWLTLGKLAAHSHMPPGASLENIFEVAPNRYRIVALEAAYETERDGCAGV